jgi:hypothetical protein
MDDEPVDIERLSWTPVDPDRCAVRGEDVCRPADGDVEPCRRLFSPNSLETC